MATLTPKDVSLWVAIDHICQRPGPPGGVSGRRAARRHIRDGRGLQQGVRLRHVHDAILRAGVRRQRRRVVHARSHQPLGQRRRREPLAGVGVDDIRRRIEANGADRRALVTDRSLQLRPQRRHHGLGHEVVDDRAADPSERLVNRPRPPRTRVRVAVAVERRPTPSSQAMHPAKTHDHARTQRVGEAARRTHGHRLRRLPRTPLLRRLPLTFRPVL